MTKSFFSRKYFSSDLIQSSRCTTDWWLILIFQAKNGFLVWHGFMTSDWPIRSDQLFKDQYLIKLESSFSHMDLSLTDFMIINSWHKRVVTFVTRDSVLHVAVNLYIALNLDGMVLWRLLTIRLWNLLICPRFFVNRLFWSALVGVWCQIMLALRILLVNHFIYWNVNKDTIKFKNTITQELPEIKFKWKSFPDWIISALIFCRSVSSRLHFNAF